MMSGINMEIFLDIYLTSVVELVELISPNCHFRFQKYLTFYFLQSTIQLFF